MQDFKGYVSNTTLLLRTNLRPTEFPCARKIAERGEMNMRIYGYRVSCYNTFQLLLMKRYGVDLKHKLPLTQSCLQEIDKIISMRDKRRHEAINDAMRKGV